MASITPEQVQQMLAKIRAVGKHSTSQVPQVSGIEYNNEQSQFIDLATSLQSCILIGSAGTGKTTCMKGTVEALVMQGKVPILEGVSHKYLPSSGVPGIVACSFTRRAVRNLRKALPPELQANCITIHKLLEYEPVFSTVLDPETGEERTKMSFAPTRDAYNPLPSQIRTVIIDESSMVSVELFQQLQEALPHNPQFIFLGDIQQLPPVFGSAILGFKMLELPTVELIQIYRQALDSPIIKYATMIRNGETFAVPSTITEKTESGTITLHPWKKKLSSEIAKLTFCKFITAAYDSGQYDPESDAILIPFNKAFGTDEVNKHIANHIAKKVSRPVYEIIAGFNKLYFSVGDRILFDKEDAIITGIEKNRTYLGKHPQAHSVTMDYFGYNSLVTSSSVSEVESEEDINQMLEALGSIAVEEDEERVRQASHSITIRLLDTDQEFVVNSAAALNSITLSYAMTVHKAQGSEWDKVFLVLHQSHSTMCQRELLYTGVTRAAKELYVICEPDTFVKGVLSQKIKGNTLAEKAEYFKGKIQTGAIAR